MTLFYVAYHEHPYCTRSLLFLLIVPCGIKMAAWDKIATSWKVQAVVRRNVEYHEHTCITKIPPFTLYIFSKYTPVLFNLA